jgi:hypothetical protein
MAIYGTLANSVSGSLKEVDLSAISSTISDTAVDVFVYDTSKDSDGGAWRNRTQHTSWYNETLNTATRGSRREFPAVAVIVSTLDKVTIYDGDDPDMPMWMVFNGQLSGGMSETFMLQYASQNGYFIHALNGILVIGEKSNSDNWGSPIIRFISEYVNRMDPQTTSEGGVWNGNIADRNSSVGYRVSASETYGIVNSIINDVAMTVLPNAPIDSATGLPIPTIAVATDAGVSVIKDDGTVVDSAFTSSVNYLSFSENGDRLFVSRNDSKVFTSTITSSISSDSWGNDNEYYRKDASNTTNFPWINEDSSGSAISRKNEKNVYGSQHGLTIIDETPGVVGNGMGAWIESNYNTGWMHGDIKGAFLSDTDATNVTGTELVANGTFDTDTTGWSAFRSATLSVSSGALRVTNTSLITSGAHYQISTEIGKEYVFSFDVLNTSAFNAYVGVTNSNTYNGGTFVYGSGSGYAILPSGASYSGTFIATDSVYYIHLHIYGGTLNGGFLEFDNVSVRLSESDRSVNNNGLQVFGTITKSPVAGSGATAAELVAYGNFNSSNYLLQPYNSDLDFGTGDFCYMCWVKDDNVQLGATIFQRGSTVNANETVFFIDNSKKLHGRVLNLSSVVETATNTFIEGKWNHCVFLRSGGTSKIFHNGIEVGSTSNTQSMNQPNQSLSIGAWLTNNSYFPTSISLFRVSASAPSPEQIKKIYEDEKVLFQENAACTLYGSSDAVTALAYDDSTNLLYAGTSSGRSDFQGLRRINNTTTAVTTAISASNGLVVEQ